MKIIIAIICTILLYSCTITKKPQKSYEDDWGPYTHM